MTPYSKVTRDYEDYLLRLIFRRGMTISGCIHNAYLDLNRTLHGMRKLPEGADLRSKAEASIAAALTLLKTSLAAPTQQADFDKWHRTTCDNLVSVYGNAFPFTAGEAQKWVNMTVKYIYTIGEDRIPGFGAAYAFCHAPLDNDVLDALWQYGFDGLSKAWSRIDYDEYFKCQEWIRNKFKPTPPLSIEFYLWMGINNISTSTSRLRAEKGHS
ncbi:MAG: hypothetical protein WBQ76_14940 [Candidatus Korobacteraceae bacterium]